MKCSAIGKRTKDDGKIIWCTSRMLSGIFTKITDNLPANLLDTLDNLQHGYLIPLDLPYQKFAFALNLDGNISLVITDGEMSNEQMVAVHRQIFTHNIPLQTIFDNFARYCPDTPLLDPKTAAIREQLEEVKEIMQGNIDKAIARGGQLKEIETKTQQLEMQTKIYRTKAEELNSCWPDWTNYCNVL